MARIRVTREELYEQVWTTPISRLAMQYGISDVALAKTCRRMNIPTPGRGYWQQLAVHVKVKRAPLPRADAHEEWTFLDQVENPTPKARSPKAPDVPVADTLHGAHEAVQRLGGLLQRAKPDEFDRLVVPGNGYTVLCVTVGTHRRALLLLDALLKALVSRGHTAALERKKTDASFTAKLVLTASATSLEVELLERLDRRERARTPKEQESVDFWAKLRDKPAPPPTEQFASGRLQLVIHGLSNVRSSWSDGKTPVESHLGQVVVAVDGEAQRRRLAHEAREQAAAEAEQRKREQEAEAERLRREQAAEKRRRRELEVRQQYERALRRDVRGLARRWAMAAQVRAFLEAVEDVVPVPDRGEGFSAWFRWANQYAEQLDPLSEPHRIAMPLEPDLEALGAGSDGSKR